jgi:hypothetical protein
MQDTKCLMLTYERLDILEIVGYVTLDYVGCINTKKSMSCYMLTLAKRVILWKSSKQIITTSSTVYAKFVACYEAIG